MLNLDNKLIKCGSQLYCGSYHETIKVVTSLHTCIFTMENVSNLGLTNSSTSAANRFLRRETPIRQMTLVVWSDLACLILKLTPVIYSDFATSYYSTDNRILR